MADPVGRFFQGLGAHRHEPALHLVSGTFRFELRQRHCADRSAVSKAGVCGMIAQRSGSGVRGASERLCDSLAGRRSHHSLTVCGRYARQG